MAISIFPSTAAEFVSNNFVVDMNDTTNNTADTGGVKQAGPYSMSFSSGDTSFDVYLIDEDGNSVGYSNSTSITASGLFSSVVILGVANDEIITFNYSGSVNNADGEGDEPGAGAYLESITPSDLPGIDDTATVIGGNFGANTEITFESGATVLSAKSITVVSGTELLVTRPDGLIEDNSPYTVRAVTTGVPQPTGTNSNILTDAVTAGSDPTWVTTSPLNSAPLGVAFSQTLEATDADGTVVDYSVTGGTLTTGLTLDSTTGILSGTATESGPFTFTVTATDDGGNTTPRTFTQSTELIEGGVATTDGVYNYNTFTSTDTMTINASVDIEWLVIAGGGGGGFAQQDIGNATTGGGGAGGLQNGSATASPGDYTVLIGAGGAGASNGSDSSLATFATATGGGSGGDNLSFSEGQPGAFGGSGGGGANGENTSGSGGGSTSGGNNGGSVIRTVTITASGGGGGAGQAGTTVSSSNSSGDGGDGLQFSDWASATSTGDNGFYAGGGAGGEGSPGNGGGGSWNGFGNPAGNGAANTGGGGGARGFGSESGSGGTGGSGLVIVRHLA